MVKFIIKPSVIMISPKEDTKCCLIRHRSNLDLRFKVCGKIHYKSLCDISPKEDTKCCLIRHLRNYLPTFSFTLHGSSSNCYFCV